jgi:lactam utilization protein B
MDTLCLHGDHPNAAGNAKMLRGVLGKNGIEVVGLKK